MKRSYYGYLYVIAYLMLLRIVLNITVGISVFSVGVLFDLVLMMFWIGAIAYFLKRIRMQKIFYIFSVIVSTIFVVGDSVYHDYFGIISSKTSLAGLKFLSQGQTLEYDIHIPLVAYLITPILIGVIYLIISNKKKDVFVLKDFGVLSIIFVVQVGLFLYWGGHEFDSRLEYYRSDAYLFESMHDRVNFSEKYGYYNYHILDITRLKAPYDEEAFNKEIDEYFDNQEVHQSNEMTESFKDYNLVTILAESMDTRFINEQLTPNLYMMKTNGYNFTNYFTPVFQQGATCNSEFMSLTGLQAITSNDWSNNVCDAYNENLFPYSLPNQLSDNGYHTYYFHSGYEWFYNRKEMIPQYGYDTVKFQEDIYALGNEDFEERYDRDMMTFIDEFVTFEEPFHINLLTYSGHGAYNQTDFDKYKDIVESAYPDVELDYEIINYMEKMVELDMLVGDLMERLENEGVLDNTLFAIYPDHYPYMMNRKLYEEHIGIEVTNTEVKRQNLIMYNPSMTPKTITTPGSTVDITPTLLNMLVSDGEFTYFMGTDLFSETPNYVIFSDLTFTDGKSYLNIKEEFWGEPTDLAIFEQALEEHIIGLEIQKKLLKTDYFKE